MCGLLILLPISLGACVWRLTQDSPSLRKTRADPFRFSGIVVFEGASDGGGWGWGWFPCSFYRREWDSGDVFVGKRGARAGSRPVYWSKQEC